MLLFICSLGMSAAKLLFDSGLNIVVLEARDRVGGRTFTARVSSIIVMQKSYIDKQIKS